MLDSASTGRSSCGLYSTEIYVSWSGEKVQYSWIFVPVHPWIGRFTLFQVNITSFHASYWFPELRVTEVKLIFVSLKETQKKKNCPELRSDHHITGIGNEVVMADVVVTHPADKAFIRRHVPALLVNTNPISTLILAPSLVSTNSFLWDVWLSSPAGR